MACFIAKGMACISTFHFWVPGLFQHRLSGKLYSGFSNAEWFQHKCTDGITLTSVWAIDGSMLLASPARGVLGYTATSPGLVSLVRVFSV